MLDRSSTVTVAVAPAAALTMTVSGVHDELAEIYKLLHGQVDAVMASLRLTQARVESSVRASTSTSSTAQPDKNDDAQTVQPEKSEDAQNSVVSEGASTLDQTIANQDELREVAAAGS